MPVPRKARGLPASVLATLYLGLVALPLLLGMLTGAGHALGAMRLASASGSAAAVMVLLQLVTSGRFESISGRIGIDITMAFHKWAAPVALAFAVLHVLAVIGPPAADRPGRLARRIDVVLSGEGLWPARAALLLLVVLVVLALLRDRLPMRYQVWRAGHVLAALALVATLLWHVIADGRGGAVSDGMWIGLALAVTVPAASVYCGRLLRPHAQRWCLAEVRRVAERLWLLDVLPPEGAGLRFEPGQFAWIAFGDKRLPLHDHPFSIASAPGASGLRFLVQEAGDFTATVGQLAPGTAVSIDAPHGSFVPRGAGPLILVAGGVGIAPILSILSHLARTRSRRPVRLLYAVRRRAAMVPFELFAAECAALGVTPMLIVDDAAAEQGEMPAGLRRGPLNRDLLDEAFEGLDPAACEVMTCGPGPMMTFVADRSSQLGVPQAQIAYERFSYAAGRASAKDRRRLAGFGVLWGGIVAMVLLYWRL
ncbi:ferric reductase-like transmembrane domain-containing protein [Salipiger mangrovisoli]|uniref:Ferric reductase-like transmembrane domain-containing protein n=1 Tax=Salipiger mangrovisoli TaxID=2865933 RepID=A0ABR9WYH4_9RHOB|nr:ferric reductase-like transmembrane domain-containing protein [Salipiger mangrovisoli]MBE9636328.1 ferric reductase-like transmembrane domain-containing protein [Salipiger mangrovisoli]